MCNDFSNDMTHLTLKPSGAMYAYKKRKRIEIADR